MNKKLRNKNKKATTGLSPLFETIAEITIVVLFFSASLWFITNAKSLDRKDVSIFEIGFFIDLFDNVKLNINSNEFDVSKLKYKDGNLYLDPNIKTKVYGKKKIEIKNNTIEITK